MGISSGSMIPWADDDLFPHVRNPEGTLILNDRCLVKTQGDQRAVIVCGVVVAQYKVSDAMAEAYAMVNLVEQGWADQDEVARAFDRCTRTVRRYERRFAEGGLAALGQARGYPKGRARLPLARTDLVRQWKGKGRSNRDIARELGISEMAASFSTLEMVPRPISWPRFCRAPWGRV
jgi:hypothetical protein